MINRTFRYLSVILLVLLASLPSFAWKFVSIADSRGSQNGVNVNELTKIVKRINAEGVDLVLFQGDAVDGSSSDTTLGSQFDTFLSVMKNLNCPWYFTPGNHDVPTSTAQVNVLRQKLSMPLNGPAGDEEMAYSFDHQNAHFVSLNSYHYGKVHHVQRDWLAADLAKNTLPHVFVMVHDPAYPAGPHAGGSLDAYVSERDDLWNKMTAGRVSMYFCGHEHLYQRTKHGSITQVINGTCGAPIYSQSGTVGKYHYVVVEINDLAVKASAKDDAGAAFDSWSYTVAAPQPSMQISVSADKTAVLPGEEIHYTAEYRNAGTGEAVDVRIGFAIPLNTAFVSGSAGEGIYDVAQNTVFWTIPSILPGVSGRCSLAVRVK